MAEKLKHIGIILDGNRRYAESKGLKPWQGHEEGAKRAKEMIDACLEFGINELTLYTFSKENFNRPKIEIEFIMKVFKRGFEEFRKEKYSDKGVKVRFAGNKLLFSDDVQEVMDSIEEETIDNNKLTVNFAMGYGGRDELIHAIKDIVKEDFSPDEITEELISKNLYVESDVDLIIRTSGEKRTSGFLPWQGVYAELIFLDKMWPEFTREDLKTCIEEFNNRKRRFGK